MKADIVYIDPPYNSRQYSDAYHLLENLVEWKKPEVFGVARKMDRTGLKSEYCTIKATKAFKDLVDNLEAKYILVSYNNMGEKGVGRSQAKISDKEIIEILESKGDVKTFETNYNTFTTGKTKIEDHKERIFFCKVKNKSIKKIFKEADLSNNNNAVKSPINYTGGKYKLLNQIMPFFPKDIDTFVDAFCGGFNVGANIKAKKIIANDNQKSLVRILKLMKNNSYINLINNIENISEKYTLSNTYMNGDKYYNNGTEVNAYITIPEQAGKDGWQARGYSTATTGNGDITHKAGAQQFAANATLYGMYQRTVTVTYKEKSVIKDYMFLILLIYSFNNQIRFNKNG